jgi:hypothetical protein
MIKHCDDAAKRRSNAAGAPRPIKMSSKQIEAEAVKLVWPE